MQIRNCGEQAVILSVSYYDTVDSVAAVRRIWSRLRKDPHPAISSIRPGLDCLLIEYTSDEVREWLKGFLEVERAPESNSFQGELVEVPLCYDLGEDLSSISATTGLSKKEIIRIHSDPVYDVWMIGFMPGFPYMGELPQSLHLRRKTTPSILVPAGSVAIAEEYCGIYPLTSPGGWHIVGRTPLQILDYTKPVPWKFDYGMKVKFIPISIAEYERMKNETISR